MNTHTPFNGDRFVGIELVKLIKHFGVRHAIETGMWSAHTTRELRRLVSGNVLTFDPDFSHLIEEFGPSAVADLERLGIKPVNEDSSTEKFQQAICFACHHTDQKAGRSATPILFYLDAHGGGVNGTSTNPLREELEQISKLVHCRDNCVIFIHDFQNPQHPDYGYTWGDWGRGAEPLSYSVLEYFDFLPRIFPKGWAYHHNDQAEGIQRGVIYIYPK